MDPTQLGLNLGRQFWISSEIRDLSQAIGTQSTTSTSSTSTTNDVSALKPPDKSFVNFVHGGKGIQFASAISAAKIEAFGKRTINGATPPNTEQIAKDNLRNLAGTNDLDAYAHDLANRTFGANGSPFNNYHGNVDELAGLLKKALVALLNTEDAKNLANATPASQREWDANLGDRTLAIDNATLGIAELMENGVVDEDTVVCLKDGKVLSVNSYDDLKTIMTSAAKASQKTFVDEKQLLALKSAVAKYADENIAELQSNAQSGGDTDTRLQAAKDAKQKIGAAVDRLISLRKEMAKTLEDAATAAERTNSSSQTEKEKKATLQKLSNATRTFRYTMDRHVKRSEGFGARVRRFFSNLFFKDDSARVSDAKFKELQKAEADLKKILDGVNDKSISSLADREPLSFSNVKSISKESGDLTHFANSLLRNCSKKVDKSYVAYMDRAQALFSKDLGSASTGVKKYTYTCKLGAEFAFYLGAANVKVGAGVTREVDVIRHPGGQVSLRLSSGAGVKAGVSNGIVEAEVEGDYMQGKVLTFDSFDKFVAAAYGKLALPATDEESGRRVGNRQQQQTTEVKFLGDTSGNVAKRTFRSIGFLEFGKRFDTEVFLKKIKENEFMENVTALVDGLDSNQGQVASADEKKVHGKVSVGIEYASEDEAKKLNAGVSVDGVLYRKTNDVETVNVFDLTDGFTKEEVRQSFDKQMRSVHEKVIGKIHGTAAGKSFVSLTGITGQFEKTLTDIVNQATSGGLRPGEASDKICNIIRNLQWKAMEHFGEAGKKGDKKEFWTDYARCFRACTLAQAVIEKSVPPNSPEAAEARTFTDEIRRMTSDLRGVMPREVFDNNVMFGLRTKEEPWHTATSVDLAFELDIEGEESQQASSSGRTNRSGQTQQSQDSGKHIDVGGKVTWFGLHQNGKVDKFRPWATASGKYVDIPLKDGQLSEKTLDKIVKKIVPDDDPDVDAHRTQVRDAITSNLTGAGVKVEGASSSGTTSVKGSVSIRLEYDADKKLTRFSATAQTTKSRSKSLSKGNLKINLSRTGVSQDELVSMFFNPSLARVMGDVEELVKGTSLGGNVPPSLDEYVNVHSDVVLQIGDDLKHTPADCEVVAMRDQMVQCFTELKSKPDSIYAKQARSLEARLAKLDSDIAALNDSDNNQKVFLGEQFLLLATQTMRLASMYETNKANPGEALVF